MKQRLNVNYYLLAFEGKTLEEAEAIAMESIKGCERPSQAIIAFNALELKYEKYKAKDLSGTIKLGEKIRSEFKLGATKKYLIDRYNVKAKRLEEILKEESKGSFEDSIPVEVVVDKELETFKKLRENKKKNAPKVSKKVEK